MPQVGSGGFYPCFRPDETVRGQSNSRRYSQAGFQNTADEARDADLIHVRSHAFGFGLAARAEAGLIRLRQGYGGQR
jgi:hypothetical protein